MTQYIPPELILDVLTGTFHVRTFFKGSTKRRWLKVSDEQAEEFSRMTDCFIYPHPRTEFKVYDTNETKFARLMHLATQEKLKRMVDHYSRDPLHNRNLKSAIEDMMETVELQHRKLTRLLDRTFIQYEQEQKAEEKPDEATAPAPLEPSEFPTEWHHLQNLTKNTD
jgi:hypothetical protein